MRNILFTLLLLSSFYCTQAQVKGEAAYLIKYEVAFVLDSTNREDVKHEVHRLYTGTTTSNYISEGRFYRDSVMQVMRNQPRGAWRNMRSTMESLPTSEFNPIVYKDLNNSEVWTKNTVGGEQYIYQEPNAPIVWKFTEESKEIEQYTVQKATTSFGGRNYEAWFTLEVPIVDGPYVFSGLPGLILELYDADMDYHFNLASIKPLKEHYAIDSEDGNSKEIDKKNFIKSYKKFKENPSAAFSRYTPSNFEYKDESGKTITRRDIEREAKEKVVRRNNLIDLW